MAPKRSGGKASPAVGTSTPRFKREFLSDLMARFDGQSAAQLAKQAGIEAYQFSRILNGKAPFKAKDLVQIGGEFDCDIREAFNYPLEKGGNDDARAIIEDVQKILAVELKAEQGPGILGETDPDEWKYDERWVRARRCLEIIDANEEKAELLHLEHHDLKHKCQVAIAKMRNGVEGKLGPLDALVGGPDIYIITKRNSIEEYLSALEKLDLEQSKTPFVYARAQINSSDLRKLEDDFKNVLYDWGDEATIQVVMQEQLDEADAQGAFDDIKAGLFPDLKPSPAAAALAKDSVTPAPPPPANAAQTNIKDLPQYGQARAGRDGFHLPAGAEAMSYIARPFFLADVGSAFAVYCNGDSMEPRYRHGELLFVDPSRPPKRGDDVVIQVAVGGEICGYVKRFVGASDETTTVHQLNPDRVIKYPTADVRAVHLIVGSLVAGVS